MAFRDVHRSLSGKYTRALSCVSVAMSYDVESYTECLLSTTEEDSQTRVYLYKRALKTAVRYIIILSDCARHKRIWTRLHSRSHAERREI